MHDPASLSTAHGEESECPKCGEIVPAEFDICWSCAHELRTLAEAAQLPEGDEQEESAPVKIQRQFGLRTLMVVITAIGIMLGSKQIPFGELIFFGILILIALYAGRAVDVPRLKDVPDD